MILALGDCNIVGANAFLGYDYEDLQKVTSIKN